MHDKSRTKRSKERMDGILNEFVEPKVHGWRKEEGAQREFFWTLGEHQLLVYRRSKSGIEPTPWSENIYFYRQLDQVAGGQMPIIGPPRVLSFP